MASFTGSLCIDHVGHAAGDGYSAQANMMAGDGVCEAMAAAFETTVGSLATRLLAALVAADSKGGDARGQMSAALIGVGRIDDAADAVRALVASRPSWEGVLRALIDRGFVPMPEGLTLDLLLTRPA